MTRFAVFVVAMLVAQQVHADDRRDSLLKVFSHHGFGTYLAATEIAGAVASRCRHVKPVRFKLSYLEFKEIYKDRKTDKATIDQDAERYANTFKQKHGISSLRVKGKQACAIAQAEMANATPVGVLLR